MNGVAATILDSFRLKEMRLQALEGSQREVFDFLSHEQRDSAREEYKPKDCVHPQLVPSRRTKLLAGCDVQASLTGPLESRLEMRLRPRFGRPTGAVLALGRRETSDAGSGLSRIGARTLGNSG